MSPFQSCRILLMLFSRRVRLGMVHPAAQRSDLRWHCDGSKAAWSQVPRMLFSIWSLRLRYSFSNFSNIRQHRLPLLVLAFGSYSSSVSIIPFFLVSSDPDGRRTLISQSIDFGRTLSDLFTPCPWRFEADWRSWGVGQGRRRGTSCFGR